MSKVSHEGVVKINSRKFDGTIHKSWEAYLIERTENLLVLVGEFNEQVNHPNLGVIRRGTVSQEYFWLNRGYNIFRFHESKGDLRNFYCNLCLPPTFDDGVLNYVDLDVDVLVWSDFSIQILDVEEFEENARIFGYSEGLREDVKKNLSEVISMIEQKAFPFDCKF